MTFKVTKTPIAKDIFEQVRKEFSSGGNNARIIKAAILDDMKAGVSPVEGKTWDAYSDSYRSVIKGEKFFRKVGNPKSVKAFNGKDKDFFAKAAKGGGKSVAPVNLKVTGDLYKSLSVTTGRVITILFDSYTALVHNDLGVVSKVGRILRRILPTKTGEQFNETIFQTILKRLDIAVDTVVKRNNRQ